MLILEPYVTIYYVVFFLRVEEMLDAHKQLTFKRVGVEKATMLLPAIQIPRIYCGRKWGISSWTVFRTSQSKQSPKWWPNSSAVFS